MAKISHEALSVAMKKAVEVGIFPKLPVSEEVYLKAWEQMGKVLEAFLDEINK